MTLAHIGLGGNLGDPLRQMAAALRLLDVAPGQRVEAASPVYRTPPWGKRDQPDFLNCAAAVRTDLSADGFLARCLDVERRLHRERGERWGPRTIDIDLLEFGGLVRSDAALHVPHPRMLDRAFVLLPLSRIAPDLAVAGRTVAAWLAKVPTEGIELAAEGGDWWRDGPSRLL